MESQTHRIGRFWRVRQHIGPGPGETTHERRPQRAVHGARWYPDTPPATAEPPHCGLIGVLWLASSLGGRPCHPLARGRASWHRTAAASPSRESKHTGVGFRAAARAARWEPAAVMTTQAAARGMWDGEPNPPNWPVLEGQAAHRAGARRNHARETAAEGRAQGEVVSGHPPATAEPPHCGLIGVLWLASSLGGRPCHPLARGRASWRRTAAASPSRESKHTGVGFRAAARAARWEPAAVVTTQAGARGMWDGEPNPPNWPVLEGQAAHRAWARRNHARETAAEGRARGEVVSGHPPCHGGTAPLWPDRRPLAGLEPRRTTVSPPCTRQSILAQDSRCLAVEGEQAHRSGVPRSRESSAVRAGGGDDDPGRSARHVGWRAKPTELAGSGGSGSTSGRGPEKPRTRDGRRGPCTGRGGIRTPPCHGGTAPLWPDRRPLAGLEPRRTTVSPPCTRQSILAQNSRCLAILGRVAGPDQEWQEELAATVGEATVKRVPERRRGGPRMPDQGGCRSVPT